MFGKVLNTFYKRLVPAHIVSSKYKWFSKNYQKHHAVFTPKYPGGNVDNLKFFEPKDVITV